MHRPVTACLLFLAALAACRRAHHPNPDFTVEEPANLASEINVADPQDSAQLLNGFYQVEQNSWRWTAREFSVTFAVPREALRGGARLEVDFAIPDVAASDLAGLTLSASINDQPLAPFTARQTGPQTAVFSIPAKLLPADAIIVDFSLDKTVAPRRNEDRILGIIVSRFRLRPAASR